MNNSIVTFAIAASTAAGVVFRPFRLPEAVWAIAASLIILALGILSPEDSWAAIMKGADVYLFLVGMMLLSELARKKGLFDWIAAIATLQAKGSPRRLFVLVYFIGIVVTALLSNDATAVVLTPAVYAACRAAKVRDPLPYLLICAFIANAASFLLPISNPANLVIFAGGEMPPLSRWLTTLLFPSFVAIAITFITLYWTQRRALADETLSTDVTRPELNMSAMLSGIGLVVTAFILVGASALHADLGLPTFFAGIATTVVVLAVARESPFPVVKHVSWGILPLVAGLFVVVEAVNRTGISATLVQALQGLSNRSDLQATAISGAIAAFVSNAINNLPAGLFAGSAVQAAQVSDQIAGGVLIGVDLGPNLSVTGSLATILWLSALRREGIAVSGLQFLKLGILIMIPALSLSLAALALMPLALGR